jgi:hypothetical protein
MVVSETLKRIKQHTKKMFIYFSSTTQKNVYLLFLNLLKIVMDLRCLEFGTVSRKYKGVSISKYKCQSSK